MRNCQLSIFKKVIRFFELKNVNYHQFSIHHIHHIYQYSQNNRFLKISNQVSQMI